MGASLHAAGSRAAAAGVSVLPAWLCGERCQREGTAPSLLEPGVTAHWCWDSQGPPPPTSPQLKSPLGLCGCYSY